MPIENIDEFYAGKADDLSQIEAANKREEESKAKINELMLDKHLSAAYRELGGSGNDDDRDAYDAIKRHLKDSGRVQFEKGEPVFIGEDGQPKTADEIVIELKQHPTYKLFFSADSSNQAEHPAGPKTYKLEDARQGKASIEDIASGKIEAEGIDSTRKPDTKVINASDIAKTKSRRWK